MASINNLITVARPSIATSCLAAKINTVLHGGLQFILGYRDKQSPQLSAPVPPRHHLLCKSLLMFDEDWQSFYITTKTLCQSWSPTSIFVWLITVFTCLLCSVWRGCWVPIKDLLPYRYPQQLTILEFTTNLDCPTQQDIAVLLAVKNAICKVLCANAINDITDYCLPPTTPNKSCLAFHTLLYFSLTCVYPFDRSFLPWGHVWRKFPS